MLRNIALLSLLVFGLASVSTAADDFARNGVAVGAGLGFAGEDFDSDGLNFDDTGSAHMLVDWRFHPHLGLEGRFEHTFNFDASVPGTTDVRATVWSLTANGQVFILTGQFQPYFELGIGVGEGEVSFQGSSNDTTNAMGRVGLGLDSYLNRNISVGAEFAYNFGFGNLSDFNYWTMGGQLKYHF
jgi:opacity protein-like surface antigen